MKDTTNETNQCITQLKRNYSTLETYKPNAKSRFCFFKPLNKLLDDVKHEDKRTLEVNNG